jgi:hypothetical protein
MNSKIKDIILSEVRSFLKETEDAAELDNNIINSFRTRTALCPEFFYQKEGNYEMHYEIREALADIAKAFLEFLDIDVDVEDVTLTGSLANFNWSDFSDIDLHIVVDFLSLNQDPEFTKQYFDAKKNLWNQTHNISIKGFDVEVYVQDKNEKHSSSGVYSVLDNKWLVKPEFENPEIDKMTVQKKAEMFSNIITNLEAKANQGKDVTKQIDALKTKLGRFRQAGLDREGEYSNENLVFKLLRRNGSIEKLVNIKTNIQDKNLSLAEQE